MDGAAAHEQQLQIQRQLEETILKSTREPLTTDDARLLAWQCGINIPQLDTKRN